MKKSGFTLIELLIVVAIIGVLISMAIPKFSSLAADRNLRVCQANLRTMDSAIQIYAAQSAGTNPPTLTALVTEGYMVAVPECPNSSNSYGSASDGDYATCTVDGHTLPGAF